MLLTVNGTRTARELAALVKALMDSCTEGGPGDLDAVFAEVAKRYHIAVPQVQREQVLDALAAVSRSQQTLYTLLAAAWVELSDQAQAEATREHQEHEQPPRDPVADAIRQLTISGRYHVVAHNGRGKPLLSRPVIGLGLAAGAVAELVIAGRIGLDTRTHRIIRTPAGGGPAFGSPASADPAESATGPTPSRAAERALEEMPAQPTPLRDHLAELAPRMESRVRTELVESGLLHPEAHGRLRERVYYAPSERGLAGAIRVLVGGALHADPIAVADAVLAELVIATALDARQPGGWDRLASMTRGDALAGSRRPEAAAQLKLLVDLTAAEVDEVVTSPGT